VEQKFLTTAQKKVIKAVAREPKLANFYLTLTGGTALGAFYLKHRFSDYLDFLLLKNRIVFFFKDLLKN
jgi:hypothetical protein